MQKWRRQLVTVPDRTTLCSESLLFLALHAWERVRPPDFHSLGRAEHRHGMKSLPHGPCKWVGMASQAGVVHSSATCR